MERLRPVPARESTSLVGPPADRRDSRPLHIRGRPVRLWHALRLDSPPMLAPMPRPLTDRQRWQEELAELPAQIARWQRDLDCLAPDDRIRREMLEWMIRRDRLRMETLAKWLEAEEAR